MPVPSTINDLALTAIANSPQGTETAKGSIDEYFRKHGQFLAELRDGGAQFTQAGTGAVKRSMESRFRDTVSVKDFGAVCDGSTDDTAAVQLCVNFCLTFDPPAVMGVPGPTKLTGPVKINRVVDASTANAFFVTAGTGPGACFYATAGITMFDTDLTAGNNPSSQMVHFQNITFRSSAPSNPTYALSGNGFLRVMFTGCVFHKMRCAVASWYLQTWYFQQCRAYGYLGTFLVSTGGAYDVRLNQCWAEAGGGFLSLTCDDVYSTDPVFGCSVTNSLIQSMTADAITADRCQSFSLDNVYFEGNTAADAVFDTPRNLANNTPNSVIKITGCNFSPTPANYGDVAYYPIRWGRTASGFAAGNYVVNTTNLHKKISTTHLNSAGEQGLFAGFTTDDFMYAAGGYIQPGTGGERIKIIRGVISSAGAITAGAGFTAAKAATGKYTITFTTAFSAQPAVTASAIDSGGINISALVGSVAASATIDFRNATNAYTDTAFHFIAIGPV